MTSSYTQHQSRAQTTGWCRAVVLGGDESGSRDPDRLLHHVSMFTSYQSVLSTLTNWVAVGILVLRSTKRLQCRLFGDVQDFIHIDVSQDRPRLFDSGRHDVGVRFGAMRANGDLVKKQGDRKEEARLQVLTHGRNAEGNEECKKRQKSLQVKSGSRRETGRER